MLIERGAANVSQVLVVDDELAIVDSLADLMRKEFHVLGTDDVEEALRLIETRDIALLITDQRMPGMTGAELLARSAHVRPDTVRVLMTAYSDIQAVVQAVNEGRLYHYLIKPWDVRGLLELVRGGTRQYRLNAERLHLLQRLAEANRAPDVPVAQPAEGSSADEAEIATLHATLHQLQSAFAHLRDLQEVIPICMECGKIKTSEAKWEAVVTYLKNNSTFLSHGYCPCCQTKLMTEWGLSKGEG